MPTPGQPFDWFLVYWAMISLLLYIVAGEKMPWLLTHMAALPFALLAAKFIGDIVSSVQWDRASRAAASSSSSPRRSSSSPSSR